MGSTPCDCRGAMPTDPQWMEQQLLAHAGWIRDLARGLVRDEAGAEDLAQDTLLVALRSAPRERASIRAWLAGIARRLAWNRLRTRESTQPLDPDEWERECTTSSESIERLELYELLARELRALREPLRATLIERYVHGKSAAEIAERSGVPLPTVRWRLQQGFVELRSRLDRRFDGDRQAWMSALTLAAGSKGASLAGGTALGGGLLVSTLAKVTIGVVVLAAGLWLLRAQPNVQDVPSAVGAGAAQRGASLDAESASLSPGIEPKPGVRTQRDPIPADTASTPAELPVVIVHGRTLDEAGRPLAGAEVGFTELAWTKRLLWEQGPAGFFTKATSAADGRFTLVTHLPEAAPPGVIVTIEARKAGYGRVHLRTGDSQSNELDVGDLPLGPGARVTGRVTDALGQACAGVSVWIARKGNRAPRAPESGGETRSAADGSFLFEDAPAMPCTLSARSDDLRHAERALDLSAGASNTDVELVLPALEGADSISGTVVDPQGRVVPKAALLERKTSGAGGPSNRTTACDEHGRFRIDGCAGAVFEIVARDRTGDFGPAQAVDVHAGTHGLVLRLDGEHGFLLRVRDAEGRAVTRYSCERREESGWVWQQSGVPACDHAQGESRQPADVHPFLMRLQSPGFAACTLGPFDPRTTPAVVDARLERACTIRGIVRGSPDELAHARVTLCESNLHDAPSLFGALPPANATCGADGSFELTLEGSGTVRLVARSGERTSSPSDAITIEPGRDVSAILLELAPGGTIEGRVVRRDGSPAAGFSVSALLGDRVAASTSVGSKGEFLLRGLASGEYELRVSSPSLGIHFDTPRTAASSDVQRWTCAVTGRAVAQRELQLLDTVRARVRFDLPELEGKAWHATITSWPGEGASAHVEDLEIEARGTREFERVDPLDVLVELESGSPGGLHLVSERRPLARGENELPIRLRTGRIEGRLAAPFSTRERIELAWSAAGLQATAEAQPDADGSFRFDCAPTGTCTLRRVLVPARRAVEVTASERVQVDGL